MTIHWILFAPGVLLLLFPADRLLSSLVELRSFDCFRSLENSPRYRPWWWVPVLWIDPFRGFFGAFLLKESFGIEATEWAFLPKPAYALWVAILALGVGCQMFTRRGDRDVLLAPLGFVGGVVAALTPWTVALLGIVSAALGLFAFRQFHAFFTLGLLAVVLLGVVFRADAMWIGPASGALAVPILAAFFTGRALEIPTRSASGPQPPRSRSRTAYTN